MARRAGARCVGTGRQREPCCLLGLCGRFHFGDVTLTVNFGRFDKSPSGSVRHFSMARRTLGHGQEKKRTLARLKQSLHKK